MTLENIRLCMNPIRSAPTILYNSAPHQQVVRKSIRYYLYCFVSRVNIVIRYGTLSNLALIYDGFNTNEVDQLLGKLAKKTTNMVDVMKLFWHEIVSLGCYPGSCKHSYSGAFFVPDSGK